MQQAEVALVKECAEAINSGLYQSEFEAMGNSEGGRIEWWHRGDRGTMKQLRVGVSCAAATPYVVVTAEWPVVVDGTRGRGALSWTIPCDGSQTRDQAIDASVEVVVRVLETFRDVISGEGMASAVITTEKEE